MSDGPISPSEQCVAEGHAPLEVELDETGAPKLIVCSRCQKTWYVAIERT